jgi:hypothetical protein
MFGEKYIARFALLSRAYRRWHSKVARYRNSRSLSASDTLVLPTPLYAPVLSQMTERSVARKQRK